MIAGWTNTYIEIPFMAHGRDKNGLDCWGLIWLTYKEQRGIILPSYDEVYFEDYNTVQLIGFLESEDKPNLTFFQGAIWEIRGYEKKPEIIEHLAEKADINRSLSRFSVTIKLLGLERLFCYTIALFVNKDFVFY